MSEHGLFLMICVLSALSRGVIYAAPPSTNPSPRRWFLDPSFYEGTDDEPLVRKAKERLPGVDHQQVDAMVARLIDNRLSREDQILLDMLEERALPSLLAALSDPRVVNYEPPPGELPQAPVERIWSVLEPLRPRDAIRPLAALLDARSYWTRAQAAFALGYLCEEECLPALRKATADPEEHVCAMAMNGIGHALVRTQSPVPLDVRKQLYDIFLPLLDRGFASGNDSPRLLMALDPVRATQALLDRGRLRIDHPGTVSNHRGA